MKLTKVIASAGCLILMAGSAWAQNFSFDDPAQLGNNTPGATPVPSDTNPAFTLSFDTPQAGNQFGVATADVGQNLYGSGANAGDPAVLDLMFNMPIIGLSFDFLTATDVGGTLSAIDLLVDIGNDGTTDYTLSPGATVDSSGAFLGTSGPLSGIGPFTAVRLSALGAGFNEFGIDNVATVAPAVIPEPGSMAFLLGALAPMALRRYRRK